MEELPRTFGKYRLERRLGVGGMAETFVARREGAGGFEQHVCLKRVLPAFNGDKSFRDQFQREARLAARLRHTNIIGTIDFGSVGQVQYMALELVEGLDLRALLNTQPTGRLPQDIAVLIAFDVAHALEYAHKPRQSDDGIIHRDVTPSNILLSIRGAVKLADFGVAKALGTATSMTATGVMKGKMPYMPPEQMKGGGVDGRVDLFSLGVLLYECLAGRRPFVGAHDVEVMTRILSGDRPPIRDMAPETPMGLAAVVESLLETDLERRLPSASGLIDQLTPFVPPPSARQRLAELVRSAYGEERHQGGESDTELAPARELPMPRGGDAADTEPEKPRRVRPARPTVREYDDGSKRGPLEEAPSELPTRFGYEVEGASRPVRKTPDFQAELGTATLSGAMASNLSGAEEAPADDPLAAPPGPSQREVDTTPVPPVVEMPTAPTLPMDSVERPRPTTTRLGLLVAAAVALVVAGAGGAIWLSGGNEEPALTALDTGGAQTNGESEGVETLPSVASPAQPTGAVDTLPNGEEPGGQSESPGVDPSEAVTDAQGGAESSGAGGVQGAETSPNAESTDSARSGMTTRARPGRSRADLGMRGGSSERTPEEPAATTPTMTEMVSAPSPTMVSPEEGTGVEAEEMPARGPVRVTVAPWGEVWVSGRYMGRAPVELRLPPGRHRVSGGQDEPLVHRTVRVTDTRRTVRLHIDLEAALSTR